MTDPLDQVILVDRDDNQLGVMDKVEAHRGEGKLHRAISVYLFRSGEFGPELLVQQRSAEKIVGAHQWANTVCGNVRPTEEYLGCAHRRLEEEIGVTVADLQPIEKFYYQARCNEEFSEHEIDQVWAGWYDGPTQPDPSEVARTTWVRWSDLTSGRLTDFDWAPWFEIMLERQSLIKKLTAFAAQGSST